ncbi:class I SAM-dependent methyltransferase [Aspergillus vadensis CBS 113365]|uniref:S-adenosyl-L-methionine-dependent methyltransferase n=1 Tax=Aspergillus vadensis (strain CBS 113365 / IMI 142717 / IBT 24658) TaxID=1448311 RepID=A0A319B3G0_ASPVC|nr:hypothetical protein BO88DRAFT_429222 [Aspergillus vadensis CBS 113365]PYH64780.1 hypothetical protein BO88DRAFT_429222 [Aspergillus vadensis CBS 113365]
MADSDLYPLGRGLSDSVRLDAQHLLWKLHTGYTLHPHIPITPDMKIAEIGTGNGIWLFDLAPSMPSTVQLHGFDISEDQYPPKHMWPRNVKLALLDAFKHVPPTLVGQYDVVHVRMWASNIRDGNTGPLMLHLQQLLKPGGYIQWEEADLIHQLVKGPKALEFAEHIPCLFQKVGLDFSTEAHLEVIESKTESFQEFLVQKCTDTYLLALGEILRGTKLTCAEVIVPLVTKHEAELQSLCAERKGTVYNWSPVKILAQKTA